MLDRAEYTRHSETEADFFAADANGDGSVDEPEMRSHLWTVETGSRGQGGGRDLRSDRRGGGDGGKGSGRQRGRNSRRADQ